MLRRIFEVRGCERTLISVTGTTRREKTSSKRQHLERGTGRSFSEHTLAKKWDLVSAVCLERHPVITKSMETMEAKFQSLLNQVEFERSMKSDHELKLESEAKKSDLQKKGLVEADVDVISQQTARDLEDASELELAKFSFAQRVTDVDEQNATNSSKRKLEKNLILLVQQNIGGGTFWIPPQSARKDGETMRQAADRALREVCGVKITAQFYGNAPIGFYKYTYPKNVREEGRYGAKVFYYLAKYTGGAVSADVKCQWLDRQELQKILPPGVCKSVTQFLISD